MKDKIKAQYYAIKEDPFRRGYIIGAAVGIGSMLGASILMRANFDAKGLYIPDRLIEQMRQMEDGAILASKKDDLIALILVPENL